MMQHLTKMFGLWTKRTRVEASRKKHSWDKVMTRHRAATLPESQVLPFEELPRGWTLHGNNYVHLLLGETRPLEDPPKALSCGEPEQVLPGYPRPSDVQTIAKAFEETFTTWFKMFDRVYIEAGDLLSYDPEDDSFKVAACSMMQLFDNYCCEVLKSRLVKTHDPNYFDWQDHYLDQSIMSTPNEITKEIILEHVPDVEGGSTIGKKNTVNHKSPFFVNLNKLWSEKKAVKATQNLIVALYKLRAACELCEQQRHRLMIETLGLRVPLNLDAGIYRLVKSPGYTPKKTSGALVTVLFPAIVLPSSANAVIVPALVL